LLADKLAVLQTLLGKYLPEQDAKKKLAQCLSKANLVDREYIDIVELTTLRSKLTNTLAGIIGMAAANKAVSNLVVLSESEEEELRQYYSELLASAPLSPEELLQKVDFYQERQALLESHAKLQEQTIAELKVEKQITLEAKQALDELNAELEERVKRRTKQLTIANSELTDTLDTLKTTQLKLVEADKMASLGRLVVGIAHEINTPVGTVLTAISTLQNELGMVAEHYEQGKLSKQELSQFISQTEQICTLALNNISRTANLISSFKQVAVDQSNETKRSFAVEAYIRGILATFDTKFNNLNVSCELLCESDIQLNSYPAALSQVLSHLITNSLVHGFSDHASGTIVIEVYQREKQLIISYSDDGKGISKEESIKVFEPFYTTKRNEGGTGLGAHIVYNLVTQVLSGEIEIEPGRAKGLGYVIKLPTSDFDEPESSWESP